MALNIDGETYDKVKIANFFNSFFTTVAETLARKLPVPPNKYTTNTPTFQNYYKDNGIPPNRFRLATVSPEFTLRELMKMEINKSTGPNKLPAKFLRHRTNVIAKPLTHVINLSIMTDTVPRELKEALVTPIYKKGDKLNGTNYGPVGILCTVSKILERQYTFKLNNTYNKTVFCINSNQALGDCTPQKHV